MTKARDIADNAGQGGGGSKNLVINGAMRVAQRGTSATITTAGSSYDALDRFESYRNSSYAPNFTISQDTTGPDGFSRSLKVDVDATATPTGSQNFGFRTKVEGFDAAQTGLGTSGSKQITLSFYVKSNKTGTYGTQVFRNGSTTYSTTKSYTIDAADTWERKEITYTALTTANTPTVTTTWGIMIHFDLSSGPDDLVAPFDWTAQGSARTVTGQVNLMDNTSNYWQITGVQLEVGDKATDFEHRSYGDELEKCQRYYEQWDTINGENVVIGTSYSGNNPHAVVHMKVIKRAAPTVTLPPAGISTGQIAFLTGTGSTTSTIGTHSTNRLNTRSIRIAGTGYGGISSSQPSTLYAYGGASSFKFDAEL